MTWLTNQRAVGGASAAQTRLAVLCLRARYASHTWQLHYAYAPYALCACYY